MIKDLVKDEAALSAPCAPATADDAAVAADLVETLAATEGAACLAANQIGAQVAVIAYLDDADAAHVMYNPKVLLALGAFKTVEGCLTRDGETKVTRYDKVKVNYDELVDGALKSRTRDFTGWEAQMIQHMVDHCKGKYI